MDFHISPIVFAKTAVLTSSGIFAGYTWALSNAAVPAIIKAPTEAQLAQQWRDQFLAGYRISIPLCLINGLGFGYLAYMAAATTSSGIPFAWTFLRHVNGALSIRSDKVAGPGNESIALTYSRNEKWSKDTEARNSTKDLVLMWKKFNDARTVVLILGTIVGAWAVGLSH
ncbi:MAG: hypothetical protein M1834_003833 [Cirrosporium novae-zelandiae]|nr:MAG: hypothetical protein M1834_003833 [Cirrosporium novae-zelandiae]